MSDDEATRLVVDSRWLGASRRTRPTGVGRGVGNEQPMPEDLLRKLVKFT